MTTYEYRTDWIKDWFLEAAIVPVPNATNHLNHLAAEGWEPISITPSPVYRGLYITARKPTH